MKMLLCQFLVGKPAAPRPQPTPEDGPSPRRPRAAQQPDQVPGRLRHDLTLVVKKVPLAILTKDRPKSPTVTVEVGELGVSRHRVQIA